MSRPDRSDTDSQHYVNLAGHRIQSMKHRRVRFLPERDCRGTAAFDRRPGAVTGVATLCGTAVCDQHKTDSRQKRPGRKCLFRRSLWVSRGGVEVWPLFLGYLLNRANSSSGNVERLRMCWVQRCPHDGRQALPASPDGREWGICPHMRAVRRLAREERWRVASPRSTREERWCGAPCLSLTMSSGAQPSRVPLRRSGGV